ncbi:MAG TPA: DUF1491 family protein [Alphaproteobacteria bacterium]|nr:DUF1491 family protein [Alphaproteobacteria bacterium]HNS44855.1 DUF1491 family protein [Alphaproteobacteria bacterium]
MDDGRLPTSLWVEAHLRRLNEMGRGYYIVQKGAFAAGTVLLKINLLDGQARVLTQIRDMDGNLGWMAALGQERVAESDADAYIRRAMDRDPDVWVIEIEDKGGENPFEGKEIL